MYYLFPRAAVIDLLFGLTSATFFEPAISHHHMKVTRLPLNLAPR